mmetsp:Transcript_8724/g.19092  ORF Transcript_8724/g.19092 Transcript_8724/m.19092 type:complete len:269 (+) Transcript_8724:465-1271(+)
MMRRTGLLGKWLWPWSRVASLTLQLESLCWKCCRMEAVILRRPRRLTGIRWGNKFSVWLEMTKKSRRPICSPLSSRLTSWMKVPHCKSHLDPWSLVFCFWRTSRATVATMVMMMMGMTMAKFCGMVMRTLWRGYLIWVSSASMACDPVVGLAGTGGTTRTRAFAVQCSATRMGTRRRPRRTPDTPVRAHFSRARASEQPTEWVCTTTPSLPRRWRTPTRSRPRSRPTPCRPLRFCRHRRRCPSLGCWTRPSPPRRWLGRPRPWPRLQA